MNAGTFPAPSVSSALTVQGRVITALILREVHTLYGNTRLGYLWAIIQRRSISGYFGCFVSPSAHTPPTAWGWRSSFSAVLSPGICSAIPFPACMKAVSANQALLTFPQVTELDLMIARCIVVWGTQLVCAVIILSIAAALGQSVELRHVDSLAATLLFAPLLDWAWGLFSRPWPASGPRWNGLSPS